MSPNPNTTLSAVTTSLKEFSTTQTKLAKAELVPAAKNAGIGVGMFSGAGIFVLHAIWMLLISAALTVGLALVSWTPLGPWVSFVLGFLLVGILSLVIAGVLALIGKGFFSKVKKPEATLAEFRLAASDISAALSGDTEDHTAQVVLDQLPND